MKVSVINAARAPIRATWARALLDDLAAIPEVSARLPAAPWAVNLRVAGDRELQRLNARFAAGDHVTDVLAFPSGDLTGAFLGDLVISWQAVRRQAAEFGHRPEAEFALLAMHGFLHLLGWDHATRGQEVEMNRLTLSGLSASGLELGPGRLSEPSARG